MKLIILDRDGVINHDSDSYIKSPDEWRPIPGSLEAIARLSQSGYRIAVATNQAGVARGLFDLSMLGRIHTKMQAAVTDTGGHIDAIFFCPHSPAGGCDCRKPKPGLLLEILSRFGVKPELTYMVGDSLRDLEAAHSAGCMPILVKTGNGQKALDNGSLPTGTLVHDSLASFAAELAP